MIDFSNCERNARLFNGANGKKIGVVYNGENYLLKFDPKSDKSGYLNSSICEDLGCKIFASLGIKTQETALGTYQGKTVVACKDFLGENERFYDFASLKNSVIDCSSGGYDTELEEVLYAIKNQNSLIIKNQEILEFFWEQFVADCLIGNFDRHSDNWGFVCNESTGECKIAPVFDCGSCLFPQIPLESIDLDYAKTIKDRVYAFPNSALKINGVKINPYDFLTTTKDPDCLKALNKISAKINMERIYEIISNCEIASDKHKEFLRKIILARKEKIIDVAVEKSRKIEQEKAAAAKQKDRGLER